MAERHPYASMEYAEALSGLGRPFDVPEWQSFVIARPVGGAAAEDAMGAYPRAPLPEDADHLAAGLDRLAQGGLVSVALVPDPLASPGPAALARAFEVCRPFKTHVLVDRRAAGYEPSKHHRERIRRGRRRCRIERLSLADRLADWRELYAQLVERHAVTGAARFPDPYFPRLAAMGGLVCLGALVGDELAAMTVWFEHAGVAVSHLTASNALGYANGANFALNDAAIEHFADAGVIDLGGGAGLVDDPCDGLFQFKSGFGNARTTAYLCGAVLDRPRYDALVEGRTDGGFFPAYRAPA
jgi:hypothetical protein